MMSQKSSKNNVNLNDFKRSLLGSILFPAIALVVLLIVFTIPVISYVTSEDFRMIMEHEEVSMFMESNSLGSDMFSLIPVGMVICGMMTAIKSFYYMLRKNQVNVFFSLGVTRKTMFINRTLAGIIALFVSVLIPMLIIYIVNITTFDYAAHATEVFLYAVSMFFVSGLAGFAIGTMATVIGGNIFEAAITSFTASAIPVLTVNAGSSFVDSFLNGHFNNGEGISWYGLISPWNICSSIFKEESALGYYNAYKSPIDVFILLTRNGVEADKYVIPDGLKVDIGFMAPVLAWLAISVVLLVVGYVLYKARKAEHANSFGHFAISRAINTTFVFLLMAFLVCEMFCYEIGPLVYFLIIAVAGLIAYFVLQLIMTRKLKITLKSLKWYGVLVGVTAIALVVVSTGLFGTYNKTPDKAEIKSVSISAHELQPYVHYLNHDVDEDFVEGTSDNAKEAIIGLFDKVKNEKVQYGENSFLGVTFAFRDNNNELKYRTFSIFSEELYVEYLKVVYGSDFFDEILKEYLINDPPEIEVDMDEYYDDYGDIYYFGDENNSAGYLKTKSWSFISNIGVYEFYESDIPETNSTPMVEWIEDTEALCKALYNDLTKMTYEQLFERKEKPLGILAMGSADSDFMGTYCMHDDSEIVPGSDMAIESRYALVSDGIPVYADMTETIAFLKSNGYAANDPELTVKEVLYTDSPLNIDNALQKFYKANENTYDKDSGYHHWIYDTVKDVTFRSDELIWYTFDYAVSFINEPMTNIDTLKRVYKDAGHPLQSVMDMAKAEAIVDKTVTHYMTSGDSGRYVYVVYEEGAIMCYYLPEANVSVLK